MPDDALFEAAAAGALDTVGGVEAQARRLLADPRARITVRRFALMWLGIERVLTADKSPIAYPELTTAVRQDMAEETQRFVEHVVFDGSGTFDELLTADFTFVNDALAAIYDMPAPNSEALVMADASPVRSGVLGHGSVLMATAHSDQSSPIRRGLFVRQQLLCQEFGPPPPDAGGVPEPDDTTTTRERFHQHSASDSCHSCHQYIDELGFGFERFGAIGEYRLFENGVPVDPAGDMNDVEGLGTGTSGPYQSLPELAAIIADSARAQRCFTEQILRHQMGGLLNNQDLCTLELMAQSFVATGGDVLELLVSVATSDHFRRRQ